MNNIEEIYYKLIYNYNEKVVLDSTFNVGFDEIDFPIKIVAKIGMKTLAEWEIDRRPSDELLEKNNLEYFSCDLKSALPVIIEENYKKYEQYYSEEEKELLKNLLHEYCNLSNDKLNDIFGHKGINELVDTMIPIKATEFKIINTKRGKYNQYYIIYDDKNQSDIKIEYDKLIEKLYYSSIINGQAGEFNSWKSIYGENENYLSIDDLYGTNREDLDNFGLLYSTNLEELEDRKYIIFLILDNIPTFRSNILYLAAIEYPKNSTLTITEVIENYIYDTFYTVSEKIQRRFITFLQRYCNNNNQSYIKRK